jgi:hypothetical protein
VELLAALALSALFFLANLLDVLIDLMLVDANDDALSIPSDNCLLLVNQMQSGSFVRRDDHAAVAVIVLLNRWIVAL